MRFAPGQSHEYRAARDLLIRRGLAWASDRGLPSDAFIWSVAFDFRHESAGGRLGQWTVVDAQQLLCRHIPRRVAAAPEDLADAPARLETLLSYLDSCGLLDHRGHTLPELRHAIALSATVCRDRALEPRAWDPAKFWAMTALSRGVDLTDPETALDFHERAQRGEVPHDEEVLAAIVRWHQPDEPIERTPDRPPVTVPDIAALHALAAANPLVIALTKLAAWIGPGGRDAVPALKEAREAARLLGTGEADLDVPDATGMPRLGLLISWARKTSLIRLRKGRLVQVKRNAWLLRHPLGLWRKAVEAFAELGNEVCFSPRPVRFRYDMFGADFAEHIPGILDSAYGLPDPLPVARVREAIVNALAEDPWNYSDRHQDAIRTDVDNGLIRALDLLTEYGVLTSAHGLPGPGSERLIALTDLGRWAVRERLRDEGHDVPVIGDLANAPAAGLLGVIADGLYSPSDTFTEIERWLSREGRTVADLTAAIATIPFHTRRAAMLAVLARALPDDLLHRLRRDPVLAAPAIELLTERGVLGPEDPSPEESTMALAESFARLLETGGPDAVRSRLASPDRAELIAAVRTSGHLDAVALAEFEEAARD